MDVWSGEEGQDPECVCKRIDKGHKCGRQKSRLKKTTGHVQRPNYENRMMKRAMEFGARGARRRERPKKRWKHCAEGSFRARNIDPQEAAKDSAGVNSSRSPKEGQARREKKKHCALRR